MTSIFNLSPTDLASLLCSRVCHDIISPVGAINNGLELLDEGGADEAAMDLIRTSARNASARLQFARIAFGAAGSAGVQIDTGDAETVAREYIRGEKPELSWSGERAYLPKNKVKLLLNLILVANGSIPRGGTLDVALKDPNGTPSFTVSVTGKMLRVPPKFQELYDGAISGSVAEEPIDAHGVQHYYTLLLAKESGMKLDIASDDEKIVFTAS
ncbi:histidine phosphotransferase ChpT [Oricola cellulosilytica]|uniref:Histidine phosphotransferase n=1 Tax=Oricola cellulosilytica TaxID=1429082 RepID=A0A4R0PG35_9HYPH|nr:histidine phosphotransferase family protein [Oricola cellulosilytica]TCD15375.1 histidine phosphotransferase [Oricola cellulosilytica]